MNKWVRKSINLASSSGYLDKLFDVYPVTEGELRDLPEEIKKEIINSYKKKNKILLIKSLLKLKKFPIDDPYMSSFRKCNALLEKNPKTVNRIGKRLLSMSIKKLINASSRAKVPSKQFGNTFKNWLMKLGYPFLSEEKFEATKKIAFLEGGDQKLKNYAIKKLGIKNRELAKGLDFIIKIKDKFILGEAKFLTSHGGTQDNQFKNAIKVAKIKRRNVIGVAVLDGIVWFRSNAQMHRTVKRLNGVALSALLLKNFIRGSK